MVASQKGPAAAGEIPDDIDELIELLGGDELLRKQLHEYEERCRRLDDMLPELTHQYPDQWAALTESGELLIAPSLEELTAQFRELDTRPGSNAIEFLDTDPAGWIL